jgi:hypothetical protein
MSKWQQVNDGHVKELPDKNKSIRKVEHVSKLIFSVKDLLSKCAIFKTVKIIILYEVINYETRLARIPHYKGF